MTKTMRVMMMVMLMKLPMMKVTEKMINNKQ